MFRDTCQLALGDATLLPFHNGILGSIERIGQILPPPKFNVTGFFESLTAYIVLALIFNVHVFPPFQPINIIIIFIPYQGCEIYSRRVFYVAFV
jgi:hypothetical protein